MNETLSNNYQTIHGSLNSNEFLLESTKSDKKIGKLIPDYQIQYNNKTVIIADAKYKRLGDAPWMSPKRDDLYQMTAYLSHYSKCSGYLFYPDWKDKPCFMSENNPWKLQSNQEINFVHIPLKKEDAITKMKAILCL